MELNGRHLYLDGFLKKRLDNIKKIMNKDWDVVFLIDGMEGSGKSTLGFACAWYITDGNLTIKNVCEGTEDAVNKLQGLPDKSTLIIDEGSLMFSSKEVMRKEQRKLIKILNVIRQKMMCLIIVAPSFFEMNKYISVDRSRFLLHVYTDKELNRGRFSYFSSKKKKYLYAIGKKNYNSYSKPRADFRGTFTIFDPFGEEYQQLKRKSLMEAFSEDIKPHEIPDDIKRLIKIEVIKKIIPNFPIDTRQKLAKVLQITPRTLYTWEKTPENPLEERNGR